MTRFYMGRVPLHTVRFALVLVSILLACLSFVWLSHPVSAAPSTMNFQGRLMNSAGNVMPDGLYNMQFKLYDASTSGTLLWSETRENNGSDYRVQVTNGLFSTKLGQRTALTASVFSGNSVYFEITLPTPATATCSTASCASWESPMAPRHQLSTSAYAFNSDTLDGLDSTAFAAATGSTGYIQNTGSPQTANFNITGTGTANLLQAATLDRASAGALTIGGANASSITLADNVALNSGLSLTISGGNTASRPASPTEGMVYYDTTTKQLLTYANGKWQADRSDAVLVAASDSSDADKAAADYVANGNTGAANDGDQVEINSALTAGSGKKVVLLKGTYTADASIIMHANTIFTGIGEGTLVKLADIDVTENLIESSGLDNWSIRDMAIDGDDTANTAGIQHGIYIAGGISDEIKNVQVRNFRNTGITIDGTAEYTTIVQSRLWGSVIGIDVYDAENTKIMNSTFEGGHTAAAVNIGSFGNWTTLSNNIFRDEAYGIETTGANAVIDSNQFYNLSGRGVYVNAASQTIVSHNLFDTVLTWAVEVSGASADNSILNNSFINTSNLTISLDSGSQRTKVQGNTIYNPGDVLDNNGIYIGDSDSNSVIDNTITDTSCSSTCYAIYISNSTSENNYLSGNTFSTTSGTATINDAGTGTIYANQSKSAGGLDSLYKQAASVSAFQIQNASSAALLTADSNSTNNRIQIGSSTTDATAIFFMLDSYNNGTDPTGANGAMYYNTNTNKFRCYQASAWSDCIGSGGGGANTGLSNLASVAINQSLVAGTGNSIDIGSSGTTWRAGYFGTSLNTPTLRPAADGTTAFKLQNAAGTADYLTLDTTNNRLTLGTSDTTGFLLVLDTKTDATDPTGVNGGMYYNSNLGKFRCYENGVWKDCVGFSAATTTVQSGDTVSNSTTETTFASNVVIPANNCQVGKSYQIIARGVYGSAASAPTLRLRVKADTTNLLSSSLVATNNSLTDRQWSVTADMTCITTGGSGSVEAQGTLTLATTANAATQRELSNTSTVTLDTTTSHAIQLSAQFGTADPSNTITLRQLIVRSIN